MPSLLPITSRSWEGFPAHLGTRRVPLRGFCSPWPLGALPAPHAPSIFSSLFPPFPASVLSTFFPCPLTLPPLSPCSLHFVPSISLPSRPFCPLHSFPCPPIHRPAMNNHPLMVNYIPAVCLLPLTGIKKKKKRCLCLSAERENFIVLTSLKSKMALSEECIMSNPII